MKRIKLYEHFCIILKYKNPRLRTSYIYGIDDLIKFVQNNYRRRIYNKKGYSCHCGKFHKPMVLCKKSNNQIIKEFTTAKAKATALAYLEAINK